jgi:uncharacterized protein YbjT (DUF2867 family)
MKIAVTGGSGFVGRHLAQELVERGHRVVLLARGKDRRAPEVLDLPGATFFPTDLSSARELEAAFRGCTAVAHLAGINREIGSQTYERVHVRGTRNVVRAAEAAGVTRILLLSFLRARPDCGSSYHESKYQAEQIVRSSRLHHTILKAGVIYGLGDHLLDHLAAAIKTFHVLPSVGMQPKPMRPVAVEDVVRIMTAALTDGRLRDETVAVVGPEELTLAEVTQRVAREVGAKALVFPLPLWMHYMLAHVFERTMRTPLTSLAQVRILSEGLVEPEPQTPWPPADLRPNTLFNPEQIHKGLPQPVHRFGQRDCLHS